MIDILMPVFQGEKFLPDQLASLEAQTYDNSRLLIRDDGSTDNSLEIVRAFADKSSLEVVLLPGESHLGVVESINRLLEASRADYLMFADQDDIWLPKKIAASLERMEQAQQQFGCQMPLMVFTEKQVVDEVGNLLHESYFEYQRLNPQRLSLGQLLVQNVPSSCTMLVNRPLINLCGTIAAEAVMHDAWLSLLAATAGQLVYLPQATVQYRQHRHNYYGAHRYGWGYCWQRIGAGLQQIRLRFLQNVNQAESFERCYREILSPEHRRVLAEFASLPQHIPLKRLAILRRCGIAKTGLRRNIGMWGLMFCL